MQSKNNRLVFYLFNFVFGYGYIQHKIFLKKAIAGAYHTKSSWLKNAKIEVEEKPLWKMSRFRNAEAAVDSFRTEAARKRAFSTNALDSIPRQGVNAFKQGVYNVTTTTLPC